MTVSLSISSQANEHAVRSHSFAKVSIPLTTLLLAAVILWHLSKRTAVIGITIRSIVRSGTRVDCSPQSALLAREAIRCWCELRLARR
jgi:hypothetical protein